MAVIGTFADGRHSRTGQASRRRIQCYHSDERSREPLVAMGARAADGAGRSLLDDPGLRCPGGTGTGKRAAFAASPVGVGPARAWANASPRGGRTMGRRMAFSPRVARPTSRFPARAQAEDF